MALAQPFPNNIEHTSYLFIHDTIKDTPGIALNSPCRNRISDIALRKYDFADTIKSLRLSL
jgi:hypothetical protein